MGRRGGKKQGVKVKKLRTESIYAIIQFKNTLSKHGQGYVLSAFDN